MSLTFYAEFHYVMNLSYYNNNFNLCTVAIRELLATFRSSKPRLAAERLCGKEPVLAQFNTLSKSNVKNQLLTPIL